MAIVYNDFGNGFTLKFFSVYIGLMLWNMSFRK